MSTDYNFTSIFCDDVRHELNGKFSLMGIYTGDMYVPVFPIALPKICAYFVLCVPVGSSNSADAFISVMKGAEVISSITLTVPPTNEAPTPSHGKPAAYHRSLGVLEFPGMTFIEPTLIEVVVQIDGQSLIGGRLWVTTFPQSEDASLATASQSE